MEEEKPILSIITPAYNRGHLLRRCYESLLIQTAADFQWIIVDDGSTDDTINTVRSFDADVFEIVYIQKENGGKHTALNAAHPYIRGKYVLILDSDDRLTEDAVETVLKAWSCYAHDDRIGILIFLRGISKTEPICRIRDFDTPVDIMCYPRKPIYGIDCCEVIRTDLFLQYPFPELEGEHFIAECALWNRVSFTHQCVYRNQIIYLAEYLEDGLTKAGRPMRIKNPRGGMFTSDLRMDRKNAFVQRVKYGLLYTCYGFFAEMKPKEMAKQCRSKVLMWLCMPFGMLLFEYWRLKYRKK